MFPLRRAVYSARCIFPNVRHMSAKGPLVDVTVDNEGIATLNMQRPPVNSLNLDLLQQMSKALDDIGKNKAKAMILTSVSLWVSYLSSNALMVWSPILNLFFLLASATGVI